MQPHTLSAYTARSITGRGYQTNAMDMYGRTRLDANKIYRSLSRVEDRWRNRVVKLPREMKTSISHTWRVLGAALRTWLLASSYPRDPPRKSRICLPLSLLSGSEDFYGEPRVGVAVKGDHALPREEKITSRAILLIEFF